MATSTQSNQHTDVQAELQAYLKEKELNTLFVSLVEALLIEKPANPIGFIVEHLVVRMEQSYFS